MGLLDEAIREHLELKRRGGADPGEIARKEHEALAPVFPDGEAVATDATEPPAGADPTAAEAPSATETDALADPEISGSQEPDFSHVGQETAELDMQAVLDEEPAPAPSGAALAEQDSLEWEMPGDGVRHEDAVTDERHADAVAGEQGGPPEQVPGQERMSFE